MLLYVLAVALFAALAVAASWAIVPRRERRELRRTDDLLARERVLKDEALKRATSLKAERDSFEDQLRVEPVKWIEKLTRKRVTIHTNADLSFEGILTAVHDDCIILEHAFVIIPDSTTDARENLEGEQVIPRENIFWIVVKN